MLDIITLYISIPITVAVALQVSKGVYMENIEITQTFKMLLLAILNGQSVLQKKVDLAASLNFD